jgi:hypothetical protein
MYNNLMFHNCILQRYLNSSVFNLAVLRLSRKFIPALRALYLPSSAQDLPRSLICVGCSDNHRLKKISFFVGKRFFLSLKISENNPKSQSKDILTSIIN